MLQGDLPRVHLEFLDYRQTLSVWCIVFTQAILRITILKLKNIYISGAPSRQGLVHPQSQIAPKTNPPPPLCTHKQTRARVYRHRDTYTHIHRHIHIHTHTCTHSPMAHFTYAALHEVTWSMVVWCTQNLRRDGSSFMWHQPCQRLSTSLRWIFKKRAIKKLVTHVESHASAVSLLKRAENSAI